MAKTLLITALIATIIFFGQVGSYFRPFDNAVESTRFKLTPRTPTKEVVLVEIDSESLDNIGQWPWPRKIYADIIDQLDTANVAQIAFDIDFSLPSDSANDTAFAEALERIGGGVALAAFQQKMGSNAAELHTNIPLKEFRKNAWLALANIIVQPDGLVRTIPYGIYIDGELVPSISAFLAGEMGNGAPIYNVDFSIDTTQIPRISVKYLLSENFDAAGLEGKTIIVGAQAIELRDTLSVPGRGIIGGPELHALGVETLLQQRVIHHQGLLATFGLILLIVTIALAAWHFFSFGRAILVQLALPILIETCALALLYLSPFSLQTGFLHALSIALLAQKILAELRKRNWKIFTSRLAHQNTKNMLEQIVSENFDGIIVVDGSNKILVINQTAKSMLTEHPNKNIIGETIDKLLPDIIVASLKIAANTTTLGQLEKYLTRGEFELTVAGKSKIIDYVATQSQLEPSANKQDPAQSQSSIVCLTFRDITDQRAASDKLRYLAKFDESTGAANRHHFHECIDAEYDSQSQGENLSVIYFGIDKFENLVANLGFHRSDTLLQMIVERVGNLSEKILCVARFESAAFAVLIKDVEHRQAARETVDMLSALLDGIFLVEDGRAQFTCSIGLVGNWADDQNTALTNADNFTKHAAWAYHRAVANGGNTVCYFDADAEKQTQRLQQISQLLRPALDNGEFRMVYQPQFCLETWQMVGVEALIRWQSPTLGNVSPAEFVPVAESSGFIDTLGAWTLQTACTDAKNWPDAMSVAVNLSPIQFLRDDLPERVRDILIETSMSADRLELEITESTFLNSSGKNIDIMNQLCQLGIRFALDDFGTGYSSLSYFEKLPLSKVKIDQSFVKKIPSSPESEAIIKSVILLAEGIGLKTIAEGIETPEQAKKLQEFGCQYGQGYLYSKPVSASTINKITQAKGIAMVKDGIAMVKSA